MAAIASPEARRQIAEVASTVRDYQIQRAPSGAAAAAKGPDAA